MASVNDSTPRTVIPKWRDYKTTARLGELSGNAIDSATPSVYLIDEYVDGWNTNRTLPYAGDLLSAAILTGQTNLLPVKEAMSYVLERKDEVPDSLYKIALSILPQEEKECIGVQNNAEKLNQILSVEDIYKERIGFLRRLIHRFPYNPIWYTELSLAYANIGLLEKAKNNMMVALYLAPETRYISRSAARLLLHMGDPEQAHSILLRNPAISKDPWLMASEIAVNTSMGRGSRFIKAGISLMNSGNYSPFSLSELASAIGSVEHNHSTKKSKEYFNKSLLQPNDNSLAQAQWIMETDSAMNLSFNNTNIVKNRYEADARKAFAIEDYIGALNSAVDWISDTPFAKSSVNFAADIAYTYVKDYESAIKILKIGRKANPYDAPILNNLAYAYAMSGDTSNADKILDLPILSSPTLSEETKICVRATRGLSEFRKKNIEGGRLLYMTALEMAKEMGDRNLSQKAMLNFIREEVIATGTCDSQLLDLVDKLSTGNIRETKIMRQDIFDHLKK